MPNHEIISEVGSGLNMKRKKLQIIIDEAIQGKINEVVVAHKDRLARFGFELIENIIVNYSHGKVTVLNKAILSPEQEITQDLLSIINVFSARVNGLRKYKKQIKDEQNTT
jgi:predicted site-specific integrase-resolvase